jgi:hypothetical protein
MSKVKVANNPEFDSALPKTPMTLGGETYYLCYTFGALSLAEAMIRKTGVQCNILKSLDVMNLGAAELEALLFAGLITHKPKITFEEASALITLRNVYLISESIATAYIAALADPSDDVKEDPSQPK